jgi:hypothetical protein
MHTWKVGVHAKRMGIFGDIFLTYFIWQLFATTVLICKNVWSKKRYDSIKLFANNYYRLRCVSTMTMQNYLSSENANCHLWRMYCKVIGLNILGRLDCNIFEQNNIYCRQTLHPIHFYWNSLEKNCERKH